MFAFILVFIVTIAIYTYKFHGSYLRKFYLASKINGPPAYPLVGNGLMFINKTSAENFITINNIIKDYGYFIRVWFGPDLNVIVSKPEDVEILLTSVKYIEKSTEYDFVKPWLNEGVLISAGKKWFARRKVITPAFHFKILEEFVEVFDRLGYSLVDDILSKYNPNDNVNFFKISALYALDVMCETAMGVSVNALSKPHSEYVLAVKEISKVVYTRMLDFILRYPIFYKYSALAKREKKTLDVLHGFTESVIQRRRQELLNININNNEDMNSKESEEIGIKKKLAFLDVLLKSKINGESLTDLEIREEVDTFMFEGHDTTTTAITFCLYNIAKYPEVQQKCFEECLSIFGTDKRTSTTLADLSSLKYMDLVIKESLRLFPSVPLIGRRINEEVLLTDNKIIPANVNVIIPLYNIHRNPELFSDPDEFKPERFLESQSAKTQSPFAYIPFSAGHRNCIGQKFAVFEIKSIISKLLRHYTLKLAKDNEDPILCADLVLRPDNVINFNITPRAY